MADAARTEAIVSGKPGPEYELGVVIKRTFDLLANGGTRLSEVQLPIDDGVVFYDELAPPRVSPVAWENDQLAFKPLTDVVVQGHVYNYDQLPSVEAELRVGDVRRVVRAHGQRRLERASGRWRLSGAEPFSKLPLRYDRAYGGFDALGHARHGDPFIDVMAKVGPDPGLATCTRFHYARNGAGVGFVAHPEFDAHEQLEIPNFEFPFDPITADRLLWPSPGSWLGAPLPAGFDWYAASSFPRSAYLGLTPDFDTPAQLPLEVAHGWVEPRFVDCSRRSLPRFDLRLQQGASPGLAFAELAPGTRFFLAHLFPHQRERWVTLPALTPSVEIEWRNERKTNEHRSAGARLISVVLRPDDEKLILVWSARAPAPRRYHPSELEKFRWKVSG